MNLAHITVAWLVVILCLVVAWAAHKNARYCALNEHETTYAVLLVIAALTIISFIS